MIVIAVNDEITKQKYPKWQWEFKRNAVESNKKLTLWKCHENLNLMKAIWNHKRKEWWSVTWTSVGDVFFHTAANIYWKKTSGN